MCCSRSSKFGKGVIIKAVIYFLVFGAGIIKKVGEVWLKDLLGEVNVVGTEVLSKTRYPQPALGDIKNVLTEYVILPLGRYCTVQHHCSLVISFSVNSLYQIIDDSERMLCMCINTQN